MPSVVTLIILTLAVASVVRLITDDYLTGGMRRKVIDRYGEDHGLTYLVHCPRCTSMYVSAGMVTVTFLTQHIVWMAILTMLACSLLVPIILSTWDRISIGGGD